ncbi:MAG: hypothetical protein ACOWWH_13295, partial [Eubacteriaceae bacterium]
MGQIESNYILVKELLGNKILRHALNDVFSYEYHNSLILMSSRGALRRRICDPKGILYSLFTL